MLGELVADVMLDPVTLADDLATTAAPVPLRALQKLALEASLHAIAAGRSRLWVSLPPGTGKTMLGLELARRLGNPTVVFGPNTAIQGQWHDTWSRFSPGLVPSGMDRDLATPVTALTYQSLATFERGADDEDEAIADRLHPNGRALLARLAALGPVTIVLDECHHLLEVWGELLAEVLRDLPHATVLGLTATPPTVLDARQAALVDELFGAITYAASIPAAVREGHLAPFAELAWVTEPTAEEQHWLDDVAQRFGHLVTDLVDPAYGSTPLLVWFDQRFLRLTAPWHRFERDSPDLARAALRLVHEGLLDLPDGARIREQHRQEPTADDWAVLIDDWVRGCLTRTDRPGDQAVLDALREALPGVGYQLTRSGVRSGRSPVDRVIARSESKMRACEQILAAEHRHLGDRLRSLVLCDHERAAATTGSGLRATPERSGSARQVLRTLVAADATRALHPVLVTGRTVAAAPEVASALVDLVRTSDPALADALVLAPLDDAVGAEPIVAVTGPWTSRTWVREVTRLLERGGTQTLIGTRALLGEGWDARGLNSLVDLTTATTISAVVQTRGRALRIDPSWPEKVAITWSVVCIADGHPRGDGDWQRFVRKHTGFYGVDDTGEVVAGVAHVDPRFSPFAPPPASELDLIDADMLAPGRAARDRGGALAGRHAVRRPDRAHLARAAGRAACAVRSAGIHRVGRDPADLGAWSPRPAQPIGTPPRPPPSVALGPRRGERPRNGGLRARRGRRAARDRGITRGSRPRPGHDRPVGRVPAAAHRRRRGHLTAVRRGARRAAGPDRSPRYLVARHVVADAGWADGWRVLLGRLRPDATVWHAVPSVFASHADRARPFAVAWTRWISASPAVYAHSPEGVAALLAARGSDPLGLVTVVRDAWS